MSDDSSAGTDDVPVELMRHRPPRHNQRVDIVDRDWEWLQAQLEERPEFMLLGMNGLIRYIVNRVVTMEMQGHETGMLPPRLDHVVRTRRQRKQA